MRVNSARRVGVLAVGAGEGDDGGDDVRVLRGEGDGRADMDAEAVGLLLRDGELRAWFRRASTRRRRRCVVPGGSGVGPGEVDGAEHAAREVLELGLGGGDAVDGFDAGADDGEQLGWGGDAGLGLEQGADAVDLGVGDVDEEDVGQVGRGGDVQLADDGSLDQVDGHDLHDAHAERGEQRGGGVAGAVEVGEAVAQRRRADAGGCG